MTSNSILEGITSATEGFGADTLDVITGDKKILNLSNTTGVKDASPTLSSDLLDGLFLGSLTKAWGVGYGGSAVAGVLGGLLSTKGFMDFMHNKTGHIVEGIGIGLGALKVGGDILNKFDVPGGGLLSGAMAALPGIALILGMVALIHYKLSGQIDPSLRAESTKLKQESQSHTSHPDPSEIPATG